ncbi:MAG: hypothetical protein COA82_09430 [Alkaliphilus sp.]|nr:DEAD/DEAH box helicase family protein [Alkaliphilus transvaalensis]PHS32312.1 MAG: hypothetical protein COA82_09430 [Alkaliphilus sp.]
MRESGATKSLVVVATGVGKTFLAAFDSANFKRVLFASHREEIIQQTYATFKKEEKYNDLADCPILNLFYFENERYNLGLLIN